MIDLLIANDVLRQSEISCFSFHVNSTPCCFLSVHFKDEAASSLGTVAKESDG